MSNQTSKRVTNVSLAQAIFASALADLGNTPYSKDFRTKIMEGIEKKTGVQRPSAASLYNICKERAEANGLIVRGRLGRMPQTSVSLDPETGWVVYVESTEGEGDEAVTTQIALGQGPTKKAAQELAAPVEGALVMKTEVFLAANPDTPVIEPEPEPEPEPEQEEASVEDEAAEAETADAGDEGAEISNDNQEEAAS